MSNILENYQGALNDLAQSVVESEGSFHIPTLFELCNKEKGVDGLSDDLLKYYNTVVRKSYEEEAESNMKDPTAKKLGNLRKKIEKEFNEIPDEIKIAQAAIMDGTIMAYNIGGDVAPADNYIDYKKNVGAEDTVKRYMYLDRSLLPDSITDKKEIKLTNIIKYNKLNKVYGYRINQGEPEDIEGVSSAQINDSRDPNLSLTKETFTPHIPGYQAGEKVLVPALLLDEIDDVFKGKLEHGAYKVTQSGVNTKTRILSLNSYILQSHAKNGTDADLKEFMPAGVLYVPIVGAPSVSMKRERVYLHRITKIEKIDNLDEVLKEAGEVADEFDDLIIDSCMYMLRSLNIKIYEDPQNPRVREICKQLDINPAQITTEYLKYFEDAYSQLHDVMHEKDRQVLLKNIYGLDNLVNLKTSLFGDKKLVYPINIHRDDRSEKSLKEVDALIRDKLAKGLCRVEFISSAGRVENAILTTNKDILRKAYGDKYYMWNAGYAKKLEYLYKYTSTKAKLTENLQAMGMEAISNLDTQPIFDMIAKAKDRSNPTEDDLSALSELLKSQYGVKVSARQEVGAYKNDFTNTSPYRVTTTTLFAGIPDMPFTKDLVKPNNPCTTAIAPNLYQSLRTDRVLRIYEIK